MSEAKTMRLNKVLREFNISFDRALEYLYSQGFEIEARPTTKISEEIYQVLFDQFQTDKSKKVASKEVREEKRKEKEELRLALEKELEDKRKAEQKQQNVISARTKLEGLEKVGKIESDLQTKFLSSLSQPFSKMELQEDSELLKNVNTKNTLEQRRKNKEVRESPKTGSRLLLSNFRKSKDTWDIYLSPITFFTGTNNSGKSSVLKSLLLLDDFGTSTNHFEFGFKGKNARNHKIDCYSNAVNWENRDRGNLKMEFSFENDGYEVILKLNPLDLEEGKVNTGKVSHIVLKRIWDNAKITIDRITINMYQLVVDSQIVQERFTEKDLNKRVEEVSIIVQNEFKLKELQRQKEGQKLDNAEIISINQEIEKLKRNLSELKKNQNEKSEKTQKYVQYKPLLNLEEEKKEGLGLDRLLRVSLAKYFEINEKKIGLSDSKENLSNLIFLSEKIKNVLDLKLVHLSPQRNSQTRLYLNEKTSNDIYDLINLHSENPIKKDSAAYQFIKDWMKEFDIGTNFRIKDVEGLASIIEIEENGFRRNLVDKGFGAGQIFAIIFRTALTINGLKDENWLENEDRVNPIILIEEPEANLHPALQSKLAEFFEDAYWTFGIRFVVETHSEYLLRASQILMKEWKTSFNYSEYILEDQEEPFGVYYFDKTRGPYKMHYDEEGKFIEDFGEGFFDVSRKLTRKLL